MAIAGRPCLVNSCKINHFGINPVRGGSPPRESKIRGKRAVKAGALAQAVARELMFFESVFFRVRKAADVMIM